MKTINQVPVLNIQVKIRVAMSQEYYCETVSCSQSDGASVLGRGNTVEEAKQDFIRRAKLDGFKFDGVEVVPAYVS